MEINNCPICGYGPFNEPYESVQDLRRSYDICDCCGCEYGNDDTEQHYDAWVTNGCSWFNNKLKPFNWALEHQTNNIIRPWPPTNT